MHLQDRLADDGVEDESQRMCFRRCHPTTCYESTGSARQRSKVKGLPRIVVLARVIERCGAVWSEGPCPGKLAGSAATMLAAAVEAGLDRDKGPVQHGMPELRSKEGRLGFANGVDRNFRSSLACRARIRTCFNFRLMLFSVQTPIIVRNRDAGRRAEQRAGLWRDDRWRSEDEQVVQGWQSSIPVLATTTTQFILLQCIVF